MTAPALANPFAQFLDRYGADPVLFVREVLGKEPDQWQADVLTAVGAGERRLSIRSGHGVGKSAVLSWTVTWWICTRFPQKTLCTAATSGQLFDALAAEIKTCVGQLPPLLRELFTVKVEHIEYAPAPNESFVSFKTSRPESPEAMAGVHSDNVLLIGDEASGIPDAVFEAGSGSMSGENAVTILAGNPVRRVGLFADTHGKLRGSWRTFHVNCEQSPRVSKDFIADMALRYGVDSNAYRVRVLGEFPLADDDTIIPWELVEPALTRDVRPLDVRPIWGVDVARGGRDKTALAIRRGNTLMEKVRSWGGLDNMQVAGRLKALWDETPDHLRPTDINVDVIGWGAGVVDRLRELKLPVRGINVAESKSVSGMYANLRAELWFKGREWFAAKDCNICGDDNLAAELMQPTYDHTSNGDRFIVQPKKELGKSPDLADAFLLTLASDAISCSGANGRRSWNEPLHRPLRLLA